jgi:acetyl esterase
MEGILMALDAPTQQLVQAMLQRRVKPLHELSPDEARAMGKLMPKYDSPHVLRSSTETVLDTKDGSSFRIRTLVPVESPAGIVIYFHGGGWVLGDIDQYDALGREIAAGTDCAVVLVDYRKAPEHPYPAAVDDAWLALEWTYRNMDEIAGRPVPLIVAGESAGGSLATVVARLSRDRGGPTIDLQVLIYPVADSDLETASYLDPENQTVLTRDSMAWFWNHYVADALHAEPDAAPLRAADLSALPPTVLVLAEHDVLRSEGEAYGAALAAAGVDVQQKIFDGQMHGFVSMLGILPSSATGIEFVNAQIRSRVHA